MSTLQTTTQNRIRTGLRPGAKALALSTLAAIGQALLSLVPTNQRTNAPRARLLHRVRGVRSRVASVFVLVGAIGLICGNTATSQAASAASGAHIYWIGRSIGAPDYSSVYSLGRANLDGSHAQPTFMHLATVSQSGSWGPSGELAVDRSHLYWTWLPNHSLRCAVLRADLNGSALNTSFMSWSCDEGAGAVAVDSSHVYFGNTGYQYSWAPIGRANLDGSGVNGTFINLPGPWTANGGPVYVAVSGQFIYWLTETSIGRANLDGSGATDPYISLPGHTNVQGFAADGSHLYWSYLPSCDGCGSAGNIARVNLDGSGMNTHFITGATYLGPVQSFGGHIYWGQSDAIRRADLNGSHKVTLVKLSQRVEGLAIGG
jgi:hypothetical protein